MSEAAPDAAGERLKVGVDVDDVLAASMELHLEIFNGYTGRTFTVEDVERFDLHHLYGIPEATAREYYAEHDRRAGELVPVEGAVEALRLLADRYDPVAVTSRPDPEAHVTHGWLHEHFARLVSDVFHTRTHHGQRISKLKVCRQQGIGVLIEDRGETALECAEGGVDVVLFDKGWNRHLSYPDNVVIVNRWEQVSDAIDRIVGSRERG
jgi:uncharacterized HAD superfamily protein